MAKEQVISIIAQTLLLLKPLHIGPASRTALSGKYPARKVGTLLIDCRSQGPLELSGKAHPSQLHFEEPEQVTKATIQSTIRGSAG